MDNLPGFEALPCPRQGFKHAFRASDPATGQLVELTLEIPPLSLAAIKKLFAGDDLGGKRNFEIWIRYLQLAIARNYRGVPDWLLEESLDQESTEQLRAQLFEASGLTAKKAEAAQIPSTSTESAA